MHYFSRFSWVVIFWEVQIYWIKSERRHARARAPVYSAVVDVDRNMNWKLTKLIISISHLHTSYTSQANTAEYAKWNCYNSHQNHTISIIFKNIENNKRWTVIRSMQRERSVEINNKNNNSNNNNHIKCTNGSAEAVKQKIWKEFRDSNKLNREWREAHMYILGDVYHRWIFAHKWLHIRTLNATFDDSTSASIKRTLLLFRN